MTSSLINGDCIEYIKTIPNESVNLIVTDPPYLIQKYGKSIHGGFISRTEVSKTGKCFDNIPDISLWGGEFYRVLKRDGHCYVMTNVYNLHHFLDEIERVGFKLVAMLIWDKVQKIITPYAYMKQYELILMLRKKEGRAKQVNDISISDIITVPLKKQKKPTGGNYHNTEKPVRLMEILVKQSSNEGDTVLDPFMGIGATGIACVKHNRNFIGIEIEKEYFDFAQERIDAEQNKLKLEVI